MVVCSEKPGQRRKLFQVTVCRELKLLLACGPLDMKEAWGYRSFHQKYSKRILHIRSIDMSLAMLAGSAPSSVPTELGRRLASGASSSFSGVCCTSRPSRIDAAHPGMAPSVRQAALHRELRPLSRLRHSAPVRLSFSSPSTSFSFAGLASKQLRMPSAKPRQTLQRSLGLKPAAAGNDNVDGCSETVTMD